MHPGESDARLVDHARVEDVVPVQHRAPAIVELRAGEEAAPVREAREQRWKLDILLGLAVPGEDRVVVAEPVVDPEIPLVDVVRVVVDRTVIVRLVGVTTFVRGRDQVDQLLPERVEAVLRNNVARKLGPVRLDLAVRAGIIDGPNLAEVSVLHLGRGYGSELGPQLAAPEALEVAEEERLVFHDRTAERAAELVHLERVFLLVEELARVHRGVPQIFERRAVEGIRPALDRGVDDAAGAPPELGRERVGLDLELLDRVDRGADDEGRAVQEVDYVDVVVDAVEQVVVLPVRPDAVGREVAADHQAQAARGPCTVVASCRNHARRDGGELREVPSVKGKLCRRLAVDHVAERRRLGLGLGRRTDDLNRLADVTDLEREIDLQAVLHLHFDPALALFFEAGKLCGDLIRARLEQRARVVARPIAHGAEHGVRFDVTDRHGHAWDHGAGLVADGSDNGAGVALRVNRASRYQDKAHRKAYQQRTQIPHGLNLRCHWPRDGPTIRKA